MKRKPKYPAPETKARSASNLPSGDTATQTPTKAMVSRENAVTQREKSASTREAAMKTRETSADLRDIKATARECDITASAALQGGDSEQLKMLQDANAHLVIATLEAHRMAEEIQLAKGQLNHLAYHDVLTDLPNRTLLLDRLNQGIELARRQNRQMAIMFLDLDRFKHINDSLGHSIGDHLLRSVAKRLLECVRQSDTVSRQGGDEFVLLLPVIDHAGDAAIAAQKILAAFALPHRISWHDLHISTSIGISIYPNDGEDAETLIKSADTAMYYAKENGRNSFKFFEHSMNVRAVQRQSLESSLRRALERKEFMLYYQPKINLKTGAITAVEALVRWRHPERGLLLPVQFVPIAEDCGLILPLGRWVLREACAQAQAWRATGLPAITIAVNTSALEFRAKDFLAFVQTTLSETGLPAECLELELTESILMEDAETTHGLLQALSEVGVKLAIDDFGTGYSSLSYLRQFPIDTLKIDRSFVTQIDNQVDESAIVSAVISMGKSLKLRVIAEGVETSEQYAFLLAQQCDEGQGYYFCRPILPYALGALLQTGISVSH